jgi:hypothetical protein
MGSTGTGRLEFTLQRTSPKMTELSRDMWVVLAIKTFVNAESMFEVLARPFKHLQETESRTGAVADRSGAVHASGLQALRSRDRAPFPAPAYQSVHDLFDHTAFRGPSPRRSRRRRVPLDGSRQGVHPQLLEVRLFIALSE